MFTVIGHNQCTFCKQAIQLLAVKGKNFMYLDARDPDNEAFVTQMKDDGLQTVPQIWINTEMGEEHIGGFAELQGYLSGPH